MSRLIYPARRAVEHAATVHGVRLMRLFPVLWPLWQVETTAHVYDEQAYEVIDQFLVRAVAEAGIDTPAALARFLALPPSLVQRCLGFLALINHVQLTDGRVAVTGLGADSLRAGIRYEPKESRQTLLVERYTGRPLPRRYYDGAAPVLSTPDVPAERTADRSRFLRLFVPEPFRPEVINQLAHHPDRAEYNLPSKLRDLRVLSFGDGFLPAYLIETANHGLLAYSAVAEERDKFLELVCQEVAAVGDRIDAEGMADPRTLWTDWLASAGLGPGTLRQLDNGMWRVTLTPRAFGDAPRLPITRVGSYELRQHNLLQLWCADRDLRRRALLERTLGIAQLREVDTVAALDRRVRRLADALEVTAPTFDEVRRHATDTGASHRLGHLDTLSPTP
jgi:hypothetical protein